MSILKYFLAILILSSSATKTYAQLHAAGQKVTEPASWSYEVKKKSGNTYQLVFHLSLAKGWHIWSLTPGGDGFQIVPSFDLDKNAQVAVKGKPTETGKRTTTTMAGIDGKVTHLSGNIDYTLDVTVKGNTRITGKHTYQICDDMQCLAPVDKDFIFEIKQ